MPLNAKLELIKLLGLGDKEDSATEEQISNSITTFQSEMVAFKEQMESDNTKLRVSNTEAIAKAEGAQKLIDAANASRDEAINNAKAMTEELVERDMEVYADIIENKEEMKKDLIANRASTVKILKSLKKVASKKDAPLYNSRTAGQPKPTTEGGDHPVKAEDAKKISNRAAELQKTLGISHMAAFIRAKGEVTETVNA